MNPRLPVPTICATVLMLAAQAAGAQEAVRGIGYAPSVADPTEHVALPAVGADPLSHPMSLSWSPGGLVADAPAGGSTSTGIGPVAAADDAAGSDSGLPVRHRLHGSVSAFVGSHGMAGTALETHIASLGNSGVAAAVAVSAAHLPSLRVPGGGRVDGGNTQSASLSLDKQFEDGSHLGLNFGYARLGNSPYGVVGPYGGSYGGPWGYGIAGP